MVNLIMTVGISIEFVIHEARAFAEAKGMKPQRVKALSEMGPLFLRPLSRRSWRYFRSSAQITSIFQMYFFRMYAMILFVGLFNSLVTLPALLSFIGRS